MSIPLRPSAFRLPDFRNLGIWLRLLLLTNVLMLGVALIANRSLAKLPQEIAELAALVEPVLLLVLLLLFVLSPFLQRLPPRLGLFGVTALATAAMAATDALLAQLTASGANWRAPLAAALGTVMMLQWLDLGTRARLPALAEARLAALTARIRPHFLFNSLNAVLGVMRTEPRRAEAALEELADLFRALMRDNRELTSLAEEIALARKYIDIERLRLGERLQVSWAVDECPPDALALPLLLQPLLENAIYHGIEPLGEAGDIRVRIARQRDAVRIEIDNPCPPHTPGVPRPGNHMALENLRERLLLFYDLEARMETAVTDGRYRVRIDLPMRRRT